MSLRPAVRPAVLAAMRHAAAVNQASQPLAAEVVAYQAATTISTANARKIDRLLTALTAAAGVAPVFLWIGGSDYNSANNLKTVFGGDLTLQGGHVASPTINAKSLRTTRTSKFLRGANATAGDSRWAWVAWQETKDVVTDHVALALRNLVTTTERGPHLVIAPQTPQTFLTSSAAGSGNNANVTPLNAGPKSILGPSFFAMSYDPADTGVEFRSYFSATYEVRNLTVYNSHEYVRIGGLDDAGTLNYVLSEIEYYAVAAWDVDLSEAQLAAVRIALYNAGVQSRHATIPAMVYLGDSTMASRWNSQTHGGIFGGAWRNRVAMGAPIAVNPGDMGGKGFNWHYGLQSTIIETINSLPYQTRYFVYTVDTPGGMGPGGTYQPFWDEIGVTVGDVAGFYAVVEQWLLNVQSATGCEIVICSYHQGVGNPSGEADRDYVAGIASANGFAFVDFWNEPHSRVDALAYGFYADTIHQTTAGSNVQAEFFTSILPHPNMPDAPRFDAANPPTITGTEESGETLTCSVGTPHVAGTAYTYQWLRNLANIAAATSSTYVLQAGDVGNRVACRVTATKAGQPSASYTAAPTAVIA